MRTCKGGRCYWTVLTFEGSDAPSHAPRRARRILARCSLNELERKFGAIVFPKALGPETYAGDVFAIDYPRIENECTTSTSPKPDGFFHVGHTNTQALVETQRARFYVLGELLCKRLVPPE